MKLLVCLKQTPDSTARVRVASDGRSIDTAQVTWAISPYDEYAVELALEHKDKDPRTVVAVVTVGPARARDALRQALAMGCDEATLVTGQAAESLEGLMVARALAKVVEEAKPDLVLCGRQASDDDQGFVGPALAEVLGWPHVATVTKFAAVEAGPAGSAAGPAGSAAGPAGSAAGPAGSAAGPAGSVTGPAGSVTGPAGSVIKGVDVWKEVEGGHEVWRASGPAVLTVQKSEKEPRYPSLPGIMRAKKKEISEKDVAALGVDPDAGGSAGDIAPRLVVVKMEPPAARGGGKIMKDGSAATAAELVRLLREEAKVL